LKENIIDNIQKAIDIATSLKNFWFRGHPCIYDNLNPRLYRKVEKKVESWVRHKERSLREHFKAIAPSVVDYTPDQNNHLS
jgi:hypothetical protein